MAHLTQGRVGENSFGEKTYCTAGGIGVISAGFLKREYGLGGIFAGASGLVFLSGIITAVGYLFVLPRDLGGKIDGLRG